MSTMNEARACADEMADAADFLHDALNAGEIDTAMNSLREVEYSSMRIRRLLEEFRSEEAKESQRVPA